jgi:hypothetical protein
MDVTTLAELLRVDLSAAELAELHHGPRGAGRKRQEPDGGGTAMTFARIASRSGFACRVL